jgi:hypothetical protein
VPQQRSSQLQVQDSFGNGWGGAPLLALRISRPAQASLAHVRITHNLARSCGLVPIQTGAPAYIRQGRGSLFRHTGARLWPGRKSRYVASVDHTGLCGDLRARCSVITQCARVQQHGRLAQRPPPFLHV